jgi:hypothetical protein
MIVCAYTESKMNILIPMSGFFLFQREGQSNAFWASKLSLLSTRMCRQTFVIFIGAYYNVFHCVNTFLHDCLNTWHCYNI